MPVGSCELEVYGNVTRGAYRAIATPTCAFRPLGGIEIGIIGAVDGPGAGFIPGIAAKTGLGGFGPLQFGVELSAGFDPEGNQSNYISSNLSTDIASFDWLELHANIGLDHEPGQRLIPTWGLSMLVEPLPRLQFVAEIAGRSGFSARPQLGVRYNAPRFVFDLLYSRNIDEQRGGGWLTLGITYAFRFDRRTPG